MNLNKKIEYSDNPSYDGNLGNKFYLDELGQQTKIKIMEQLTEQEIVKTIELIKKAMLESSKNIQRVEKFHRCIDELNLMLWGN